MKKKTVVVLIPCYNGENFIAACLEAVLTAGSERATILVYVIDNNSADRSVDIIARDFPRVRLIQSTVNLGFAGGHNVGWRIIQHEAPHCDYIYLLNQDAVVEPGFLDPLLEECERDEAVAAAQSLLLYQEVDERINSMGNVIHYLGFGYSSYNGILLAHAPQSVREINYASGAAVLLRAGVLREMGLFDDFMFMYLEDLDLGWKIMVTRRKSIIVPKSVVRHAYEFERSMKQYYYFERNRWWILLKNYRVATLVLLVPALVVMEVGQLVRAALQGRLPLKLKTYRYFFSLKNIRRLIHDRRSFQALRLRGDHEMIKLFSGIIAFQPLHSFLLSRVANPLFLWYRRILLLLVIW